VNNVSWLGHPAAVVGSSYDWAAASLGYTVAWPRNIARVTLLLLSLLSLLLLRFVMYGGVRTFDWAPDKR
jgi:hypothetical protein